MMKWFLVLVMALVLGVSNLTNSFVYAQKSKVNKKEQISVGERLTKYIPFDKPLACSVFLVDFGSSIEEVKKQASKIDLELLDESADSTSTLLQYKDPEASVFYLFGFSKGKYNNCFIKVSYKDLHDAIEKFENLKEVLYLNWDNDDKDDTIAKKICKSDNINRYISISRKGEDITVYVQAK